MIGNKYGRLTVLEEFRKHNEIYYRCLCDCGREKESRARNVRKGYTKSCGCLRIDTAIENGYAHGMSHTRFYKIWKELRCRCQNENTPYYKNYGGRGIKVCDRWQTFACFREDMYGSYLEHAEENGEQNTSIDRIDVDGDYEPTNCRWATPSVQSFNQRKRINNTSGATGVNINKPNGKWVAHIRVEGKKISLGTFSDFDDAVAARHAAEIKYFGFSKGAF